MKTILTADYLENEFDYATPGKPKAQEAKFKQYYKIVCGIVYSNYAGGITPEQVEKLLDTDYKKELFLDAQAKQLIYDETSGRGAMLRGEEAQFNLCRDTLDCLNKIGLIRPVMGV